MVKSGAEREDRVDLAAPALGPVTELAASASRLIASGSCFMSDSAPDTRFWPFAALHCITVSTFEASELAPDTHWRFQLDLAAASVLEGNALEDCCGRFGCWPFDFAYSDWLFVFLLINSSIFSWSFKKYWC
jgi:hypothetical protein